MTNGGFVCIKALKPVQKHLEGKEIKKVIVIKGKVVNIVAK